MDPPPAQTDDGSATCDPRHVVVVGPCASGKSTLVRSLRRLGIDAVACGQEHSEIPSLWRHTDPDLVIALDVDLRTIRRRRGDDWPEFLLEAQRRRLADAVAHASVVVDTSDLDPDELVRRVVGALDVGSSGLRTGCPPAAFGAATRPDIAQ
jgi:hypothetical protein